jgi:hypothetical protein
MGNTTIATFRGKTSYAKILGEPVLNYTKDGREWKMDLIIDENTVKEAKKFGMGDRVKRKEDYADGQPYLSFKQRELRKDGEPNRPIQVVDASGAPWAQNALIGNGSVVDVKFAIVENPGMKDGVYIRAVRVLDLVPYNSETFGTLDKSDPYYKAVDDAKPLPISTDLDDDLPF